MTLQEIKKAFPGYHLTIELHPTGGMIEARGCEDCGTSKKTFFFAPWRDTDIDTAFGEPLSFENAVKRLQTLIAGVGS